MTAGVQVPDGGWGWAVVSGTAIINVFNQSLLSMFGLIFGAKLESIAGTTGVTTVMSLNVTVTNFSGLLISPMSKYFSTKQITQIGVLLVSAGLAISTYTKSYTRITLGYGVLTGLGLGLIASSTFLIINSYFDKNKSQAVGLAMAGTSLGQMAMPPIAAHLIQHYGYDGTILLLSSLSLHGVIGSMFFDPVSEHMLPRSREKARSFFLRICNKISCRKKQNENNGLSLIENNNTDRRVKNVIKGKEQENVNSDQYKVENEMNEGQTGDMQEEISTESDNDNETAEGEKMLASHSDERLEVDEDKPATFCEKLVSLFDFHILLDPFFVHIMIGLSLAYTTSISFSTLFPLFLTEDLDMTIIDASTCMSILSFMDFLGRIVVPIITKRLEISHRTTFTVSSFLLAISRSLLALQDTFTMLVILSAVCGLTRAATVINQNLVIAEYSKEAHVSSAVGLNMVSKGIFVLTIGRLLGMYKDSAHNFASCILILNVISLGVAVSWTTELIIKWLFRKKH